MKLFSKFKTFDFINIKNRLVGFKQPLISLASNLLIILSITHLVVLVSYKDQNGCQ